MLKTKIDTKAFDKAFDDYVKVSKRSIAEIVNAKCWFIARNAVGSTKTTDAAKIESELDATARDYPRAPLAAILVNKQLKAKGKAMVSGAAMTAAITRFKKGRQRSRSFLRSGWLPAIRILTNAVNRGDISFSRRFAPKLDRKVKQYGKDKGSAIWARPNQERVFAEIENAVQGGEKPGSRVHGIISAGLQEAIKKEIASMRTYIERKLNPAIDKFNK